jgi:FkbM family methyltransferase
LFFETPILLARARLRAFFHRIYTQLAYLGEILRNVENPWAALAAYFGLIDYTYLRLRDKPVSAFVTKDDFSNYTQLSRISLNRRIDYIGFGMFRFSHPTGLQFSCHESAPVSFASYASEMNCYNDSSGNVICAVEGLRFIVPFPYGTFELKATLIDKEYGEPLCKNAVIVDVGAYIGDSSLFFASRGAKLVVAFEPVPELFMILKKNIALNGFEKIIDARNEAISDRFGIVDIGYLPTMPGSSGQNFVEHATHINVASTSLDDVIRSLGWVDILKMDCEGCEHKALKHAVNTGSLKNVGMILVEVHSDVRSLIELLKSDGLRIVNLTKLSLYNRWILRANRQS